MIGQTDICNFVSHTTSITSLPSSFLSPPSPENSPETFQREQCCCLLSCPPAVPQPNRSFQPRLQGHLLELWRETLHLFSSLFVACNLHVWKLDRVLQLQFHWYCCIANALFVNTLQSLFLSPLPENPPETFQREQCCCLPHLPEIRQAQMLCKVTHCARRISANTRPRELGEKQWHGLLVCVLVLEMQHCLLLASMS